jgi:hypothetical protein
VPKSPQIDAVTTPTDWRARLYTPQVPNLTGVPTSVTLLTPTSGSLLTGATVPVTWKTDLDTALSHSYVFVDAALAAVVEGGGTSCRLDTTALADGAHTITVYCGGLGAEISGLYASSSMAATVNNGHYAAHFDGSGGYLGAANNTTLNVAGGGTPALLFGGWVRLNSKAANQFLIGKWDTATAANREYGLWYDAGLDRFVAGRRDAFGQETTLTANTYGSPPLNTWLHVGGKVSGACTSDTP